MADTAGVYVEWRVSADHSTALWQEQLGPYVFVWSARTTPHLGADDAAAELAARTFLEQARAHGGLVGLQLDCRTVTVTEWTAAPLVEERAGNDPSTDSIGDGRRVDPDGR